MQKKSWALKFKCKGHSFSPLASVGIQNTLYINSHLLLKKIVLHENYLLKKDNYNFSIATLIENPRSGKEKEKEKKSHLLKNFITEFILLSLSHLFLQLQTSSSISCISKQCLLYVFRSYCCSLIKILFPWHQWTQENINSTLLQLNKEIIYVGGKQKEPNAIVGIWKQKSQLHTSEQEACIAKSLKQLITHCWISRPKASKVDTVDNNSPGFPAQQMSILVSTFLLWTSNCKQIKQKLMSHSDFGGFFF